MYDASLMIQEDCVHDGGRIDERGLRLGRVIDEASNKGLKQGEKRKICVYCLSLVSRVQVLVHLRYLRLCR